MVRGRVLVAMVVISLVGVACSDSGSRPARTSGGSTVPTVPSLAWRDAPAANTERSEVGATAVGPKIYVAGGFDKDGGSLPTVEVFDAQTGTWSRVPDLPVAVNHGMAASFDSTPYVFGGYDSENRSTKGAFRLVGNEWRRVAPMPKGRGAATAVAVGDRIYVVGGVEVGRAPATDMLVYDPVADRWSELPGPPTPREHLGGAGFDGKLYIVGGRAADRGNFDALERFDPATQQWERLAPMPTKRGGLAATATCNGQIVAVGGEADDTFPEVEAFDVASTTWRALPDLPTPRHGLGVVAVGANVHVLAGGRKPGLTVSDVNEVLDLGSLGSCR